ncbi:MAG: hypothetical protein JO048_11165 [Methylobacteriaceae bacterium]|nr:hypothetical protein [Methylobacteriaceae bacterium]
MAEPDNLVLVHLRELRADLDRLTEAVDRRFERIENRLESVRAAAFGESVLGRYAAAEVEDKLQAIERRLLALEAQA